MRCATLGTVAGRMRCFWRRARSPIDTGPQGWEMRRVEPLRLLPAGLVLIGLVLSGCSPLPSARPRSQPTPSPLEIVEQLQEELIPPEGSPSGYGPNFSSTGYQALIRWNAQLGPEAAWAADYEAVDIRLPCCAAEHPFADESKNCGCGHHQALYGAAKYLLRSRFSLARTQAEVDRWRAYFFPRERLAAVMEERAEQDPEVRRALQELMEKGGC
jgi:hypothetical protein